MTSHSLCGLIGYPLDHSLSPRIHAYWAQKYTIDTDYKLFTTQPPRLRQTMLHMRKKNVVGVNITIPHKQTVGEYLDGLDALATRIGAVNTVFNQKNKFIGTNTDAYGFITNLEKGLGDLKNYLQQVVILGAGGATRAAIVALQDAGATNIILTNRTEAAAQTMARHFKITHVPWEEKEVALKGATLLINTTSLGMAGKPNLQLDISNLDRGAAIHDIVYAPLETELLKNARLRGHPAVDGLGMLLYQAQKAFEIWHGILPEVTEELRQHVLGSNE
jgi:shikimate dehydrogenase